MRAARYGEFKAPCVQTGKRACDRWRFDDLIIDSAPPLRWIGTHDERWVRIGLRSSAA